MTKKKWLGVFLNFIVPGLGNAYGRDIRGGALRYVLFFVVVFSLRFTAFNFPLFLISVALIVAYYIYLLVSGYQCIDRGKAYESALFDKWYFYLLVIGVHLIWTNSMNRRTIDKFTPINFARIPTPAMDPTLMVGDILAFKKTSSIQRNDIAVFWFPEDQRTMYIKRCIGLPGDSIQIDRGVVSINGNALKEVANLKYSYTVMTDGSEINSRILSNSSIPPEDYTRMAADVYRMYLTAEQAQRLTGLKFIKSVELALQIKGDFGTRTYPKSGKNDWNADFYGPVYVPKRGDKINLDENSIALYLPCIRYESQSVEVGESGLKIDGVLASDYQFKDNYFFMMGDSRHNSLDSRYWGFLPQGLVIGKAMYLYWGKDVDRIGKRLI